MTRQSWQWWLVTYQERLNLHEATNFVYAGVTLQRIITKPN